MILVKFILNSGKHFYKEISREILDQAKEAGNINLVYKDKRFKFNTLEDTLPIFNEVDVIEIKIAKFVEKLIKEAEMKTIFKIAADLDFSKQNIDYIISRIGVPKNDPTIEKIREIKQKGKLLPREEAYVNVLFWTAKRNAFLDQVHEANLEISTPDRKPNTNLQKIQEELNKRITKAIQDFKSFPEIKEAMTRSAILVQKVNPKSGNKEWCLVSKKDKKPLKYFGPEKPSKEKVQKEEKRIQYFKNKGK